MFSNQTWRKSFLPLLKEEILEIYVEKSSFYAFIHLFMHPVFIEYLQVPLFYVLGLEVDKIEKVCSPVVTTAKERKNEGITPTINYLK